MGLSHQKQALIQQYINHSGNTDANMASQSFDHPAFTHIPTLVREKLSPKAIEIIKKVHHWVEYECVPAEPVVKAQLEKFGRWKLPPLIRDLREKAKKEGLWNLFLPRSFGELSPGLTNLEYSVCAEISKLNEG